MYDLHVELFNLKLRLTEMEMTETTAKELNVRLK